MATKDIIEEITKQEAFYRRGLLTYTEMLDNIIKIAEDEKPRRIEYRNGSRGSWKPFDDILYTKQEADELIERLSYNNIGLRFRAIA